MNLFMKMMKKKIKNNAKIKSKIKINSRYFCTYCFSCHSCYIFYNCSNQKKILKKHYLLDNEKQLKAFAAKNPNYGIVLEGIKKYYSTPLFDDLLVAFLVNTIFINNYQSIYLLDKNDYLAISLSILLSKDVNLEKIKILKVN